MSFLTTSVRTTQKYRAMKNTSTVSIYKLERIVGWSRGIYGISPLASGKQAETTIARTLYPVSTHFLG